MTNAWLASLNAKTIPFWRSPKSRFPSEEGLDDRYPLDEAGQAFIAAHPTSARQSLASLLEREARLNHYTHVNLLKRIWQERLEAALDPEDLTCPRRADSFAQLEQLTCIPAEALFAASGHAFAPAFRLPHQLAQCLDERKPGGKPLLPRTQRCLRSERAAQYCPACLQTGAFHRLRWIPRAAAICLEHGCLLVDTCPYCQKHLSIRAIVSRQCPACQADLRAAPLVFVEDEVGLTSQRCIQAWLTGTPLPDPHLQVGFPRAEGAILYALLENFGRRLLACGEDWSRCPAPLNRLADHFPTRPLPRPDTPRQTFELYRAAFTGLMHWPHGLFAILDAYCGTCAPAPTPAKSSHRLEFIRQDWFKPDWNGPGYHFLKRAYVDYLLSRSLPIPISFAHRFKHEAWFVESSGIWTKAKVAQALDLPEADVCRFYPEGSLKDSLWLASPMRGALFQREEVLAVQRRWRSGWSAADASNWLGLPESEVVHLVERGRLAFLEGEAKNSPRTWRFARQTIEEFFQQVTGRLKRFDGDPAHLCRLFEVDRYFLAMGMDRAFLMEQIAAGLLPAYQRTADIHSLEEVCFLDDVVDTWPEQWYALQGLVTDRAFAHETLISPGLISKWVASGWIEPKLDFGYVQFFDRAALEHLVASLNIFEN